MTDQAAPQYFKIDGHVVEGDALRIAQRVTEYDPSLRVQYLESAAGVGEPPFRIVERCRDGLDRIVFTCWVLDENVMGRLFAADTQKWDISGRLDKTNNQARVSSQRRFKSELEAAHEVTATVLKSSKSNYTVPEDVVKGEGKGSPSKLITFRDHR